MPIAFYAFDMSAPSRAVWMTLEILGAEYTWIETSPLDGGTRTAEYTKVNPQHAVPAIVDDDGFVVVESRAIMMHLVRRYGRGDDCALLPPEKDLALRSLVEQRLFTDLGSLWPAVTQILIAVVGRGAMFDRASLDSVEEVLGWCEDYVRPTGFVASTPGMSVADVSLLAAYSSLVAAGLVRRERYPRLEEWAARCAALVRNYDRCNGAGAKKFGNFFKSKMAEIERSLKS